MNGKPKAWALALLVGALLLGGVAGAAVDRLLIGEPAVAEEARRAGDRDRRRSELEWLSSELDLSAEQRERMGAIVEGHRAQMSALWRETRPRFEELRSQLRDDIREVLNADQRAAYEALIQKHEERHRRRREADKS